LYEVILSEVVEVFVDAVDEDIVEVKLVEVPVELIVEPDVSVDKVEETPFCATVTLTPESPSHVQVSTFFSQAVLPSTAVLQVKLPLAVPEHVRRLAHWFGIAVMTKKRYH
jgi:hypothetical protein